MIRSSRPILENPLKVVSLGLLVLLLPLAVLTFVSGNALVAELEQESATLHRTVSQRADQHDAHLTSLSALATTAEGMRPEVFLDVAATISRFYPRIDEVQLVPLDSRGTIVGTSEIDLELADRVRSAARASDGEIVLLAHQRKPHHYIMVKRSPNSKNAVYGLMLAIDSAKLLDDAGPFWTRNSVALSLSLPDGHMLASRGETVGPLRSAMVLTSASQPLQLVTGMTIGFGDLFPPAITGAIMVVAALVYVAVLSLLRQRRRTQLAVEEARLNALDSRLAHASRVNALGEMASGLAHELTQPLTAILSQVQAGRRLLAQGETAVLSSVLDDTVTQARRASAILDRFRNWSRPTKASGPAFDLRDALDNVEALLGPSAKAHGTTLVFNKPAHPVMADADPVEMEQVVFNLVRNAIDATARIGEGRVTVILLQEEDQIVLDISDNGQGVAPELRPRLFTPFTTTRTDGMGLGLALSQRLVERVGGEIALVDGNGGATFRVVLPREKTVPERTS